MPSALSAAPYNFPTTETTSGFPSGWQIKIISVGSVNHTCNFGSNTHIYSTSDYEGNLYTIDGLRSNNGGATHTVLSTSLNSDPWSQGNANQIIPGSCTEITNVVVEFYYNGSPVNLSPEVTLAGSGASTYTWDNGITDNTAFVPTATTTYTVTGTDANGCSGTDDVVVTVNNNYNNSGTYYTFNSIGQWNPYADFNANMPSALSAAPYNFPTTETTSGFPSGWQMKIISVDNINHTCNVGSNTHIYSTSDYEGNMYTIDGLRSNNGGATHAVLSTSLNSDPWTQGNSNQIIPGPCTVLNTVVVEFYYNGNPVVITPSETQTACESYTWNGTTYTSSGTYTQTLQTAAGCDSIVSLALTITGNPTVSAGADQTICSGESVTLSGSGAATYTWNNGIIDNNVFSPSVTTTYTLTGTDANGCSATDNVVITVNPSPTVNLGADVAICDGATQTLDAGSGHTNYLWSTGATTQTIDVSTSGTYSVTVGNGTPVSNSNSLSFDGTDDYVDLPNNSVNNLSAGSFMMWIKLNDNSSESIIVKQRDGNNTYSRLSIGNSTSGGGGQSVGTPGTVLNLFSQQKLFNSWF